MAKNNGELLDKMNGNGKALTVADQVQNFLAKPETKAQLLAALPKHLTPERLSRVALTTIRQTPALLECTVPSLMSCIVQAAQLGLEPGLLGHCYFVPFNKNIGAKGGPAKWVKEVQFIIGYKGLLDLARRSGGIKTIGAHAIFENDTFRVEYGFESHLQHIPSMGDRGELVGFYAFAVTKDGGEYCEVMSFQEVNAIKGRSKASNNGPWVTDFIEMGRKTVLRRLCKYLPLSVEIQNGIADDEHKEFADAQTIELNLGDTPALTEKAGKWPAIENNSPALAEMPAQEIAQANEKLKAKRGDLGKVSAAEVAEIIPNGPGDGPGVDLYDGTAFTDDEIAEMA